jgi:hypothetical protein
MLAVRIVQDRLDTRVRGYSREPVPPAKMIAFMGYKYKIIILRKYWRDAIAKIKRKGFDGR